MDKLMVAVARIPIERSAESNLDDYVNDLVMKARQEILLSQLRESRLRIRALRSA